MASTYMQIINAIYAGYLFCWIISQEIKQGKKTKMKKYTLGYKCFSFAYAYDNILFILEFLMTCQEIYLNM